MLDSGHIARTALYDWDQLCDKNERPDLKGAILDNENLMIRMVMRALEYNSVCNTMALLDMGKEWARGMQIVYDVLTKEPDFFRDWLAINNVPIAYAFIQSLGAFREWYSLEREPGSYEGHGVHDREGVFYRDELALMIKILSTPDNGGRIHTQVEYVN